MIKSIREKDFTLQNIDLKSVKVKPSKCMVLLVKAKWCGHCVNYVPTYKNISAKFPSVPFFMLETTENESLLSKWSNLVNPAFTIESFPTVLLYSANGTPMKVVQNRFKLEEEIRSI